MALEDTLGRLKQQQDSQVQWDQQKPAFIKEWTNSVEALFSQIKDYLHEFEAAGHVRLSLQNKPMSEERLGSYVTQEMVIKAGNVTVLLSPAGRMMIGSQGSVTMRKASAPQTSSDITFIRRSEQEGGNPFWGQLVNALPAAPAQPPFPKRPMVHKTAFGQPYKIFKPLTKEMFHEALDIALR
jgi:hypothetical protein